MTTVHRQFFGDAERDFILFKPQQEELERVTATGIGALAKRVLSGNYSIADLHETIRLALIGGGTDPKEAAALLAAYINPRPIEEAMILAYAIISATMFGVELAAPIEREAA